MSRSLKRLQAWYLANRDGRWEHCYGVKIDTLDTPGWVVRIDLAGTADEEREFESIRREQQDDGDWLLCRETADGLEAFCGPENLDEVLRRLTDWLDAGRAQSTRDVSRGERPAG